MKKKRSLGNMLSKALPAVPSYECMTDYSEGSFQDYGLWSFAYVFFLWISFLKLLIKKSLLGSIHK